MPRTMPRMRAVMVSPADGEPAADSEARKKRRVFPAGLAAGFAGAAAAGLAAGVGAGTGAGVIFASDIVDRFALRLGKRRPATGPRGTFLAARAGLSTLFPMAKGVPIVRTGNASDFGPRSSQNGRSTAGVLSDGNWSCRRDKPADGGGSRLSDAFPLPGWHQPKQSCQAGRVSSPYVPRWPRLRAWTGIGNSVSWYRISLPAPVRRGTGKGPPAEEAAPRRGDSASNSRSLPEVVAGRSGQSGHSQLAHIQVVSRSAR